MKTYESICIGVPEILLPRRGIDMTKWAVIACDQYTSEPEYWQKVRQEVGDEPSTLNLVYPEVYLNAGDKDERISRIRANMADYMKKDLFEPISGFVYLERTVGERVRKGIMVCLDLEQYDFRKGSSSLIRATEGTILDRIPPRVKIREGALVELPHIMVLIDDPEDRVVGRLAGSKDKLSKIYDFELMLGSGHLTGYRVQDSGMEQGVIEGLKSLADTAGFVKKYDLPASTPVLLYAMGDGNHSLATAKTIWENAKEKAADKAAIMQSPLRYALVELTNLHDEALVFEPIHRVLFELSSGVDFDAECRSHFKAGVDLDKAHGLDDMQRRIDEQTGPTHEVGLIDADGFRMLAVHQPESNLPVGTIQGLLDKLVSEGKVREIDYVHGTDSVCQLGMKSRNLGVYLPAMKKEDLFKTVILDGALPRKTFSMGEAWEKRFYVEARKIGSVK